MGRSRLAAVHAHLRPRPGPVAARPSHSQVRDASFEATDGELSQNPLLDAHPPPFLLERGAADRLARASRPRGFAPNPNSPVEYGREDWEQLVRRQQQEDLFDMRKIEAQFDRQRWESEGVLVLRGVMTERAAQRLTAACIEAQRLTDDFLRAEAEHGAWSEGIDWGAFGRRPPTQRLDRGSLEAAMGQSQMVPHADGSWPRGTSDGQATGARDLRQHSLLAEYFPAGHVDYLMELLFHPQMVALQRRLLRLDAEEEELYFCHSQLLTRGEGYGGGSWHAHPIGRDCGGRNPRGAAATTEEYMDQPNSIVNLIYPAGIQAGAGTLSVLPGGHLLRDVGLSGGEDGELRRYLQAQQATHPVTGQELEPEDTAPLPPGSLVCGLSHAPHRVGPNLDGPTRWCINCAYKRAEAGTRLAWPPGALPPVWALKARDGELPEPLARLFRPSPTSSFFRCLNFFGLKRPLRAGNGYDRTLTGGRVWSSDPTEDHLEKAP